MLAYRRRRWPSINVSGLTDGAMMLWGWKSVLERGPTIQLFIWAITEK